MGKLKASRTSTSIVIDKADLAKLQELAKAQDRTVSALVRIAVRNLISDVEKTPTG